MTKILYGVSPIGMGHASRAAAIASRLKAINLDLEFASGGNALKLLGSYGFKVHDIVTEPIPDAADGVMKRPGVWYWKYWSGYRSTKKRMSALIDTLAPDLVIGDEEFSSVSLAMERGIRHIMISDELELGFAGGPVSLVIEKRVARWYFELQRRVSHLLIPDFGTDSANIHFVGPVVRDVDQPRERVLAEFKIDPRSSMILFSTSGTGIGHFLLDAVIGAFRELELPNATFAVAGLGEPGSDGSVKYLGFVRDNQNLVAAADLVISTAGKSIIDEAENCGTPIIAIPIKNHSEQERNAKALGYSHEDIARISYLIRERIGRRTPPRDYRGAENVASYVSAMLGLSRR